MKALLLLLLLNAPASPAAAQAAGPEAIGTFTNDDTDRAVAYGWADPGAVRVGINQRWMQASCTLQGAE